MLKKEHRITKDESFKNTMRRGNRFHSLNSVWFYLSTGDDLKKIGFIVSNKVAPKASRRNKIKRKLRGFVADNLNRLPQGFLVIMIKKDYNSNQDLFEDCRRQLKKLESKVK